MWLRSQKHSTASFRVPGAPGLERRAGSCHSSTSSSPTQRALSQNPGNRMVNALQYPPKLSSQSSPGYWFGACLPASFRPSEGDASGGRREEWAREQDRATAVRATTAPASPTQPLPWRNRLGHRRESCSAAAQGAALPAPASSPHVTLMSLNPHPSTSSGGYNEAEVRVRAAEWDEAGQGNQRGRLPRACGAQQSGRVSGCSQME